MTIRLSSGLVQVGISTTPANNLVIDSSLGNGTAKIYMGNAGVPVTNVATIAATGQVTFTQPVINGASSYVWVNTANGYGSTNTQVRRFTTLGGSNGTDITYADSATLGATFTINSNGVYGISYTDNFNGSGATLEISLNSVAAIGTLAGMLAASSCVAANYTTTAGCTVYLTAGSVIRAMGTAPVGTGTGFVQFFITKVN